MNTTNLSSVSFAPASVSAQTIFARLMPSLALPSREMQIALLRKQDTSQSSALIMKESWSIGKFIDDRAAVAAICFGYEAPKVPLV